MKPSEFGHSWDDPYDVAVLTTQEVFDGELPVVFVTHDAGIGGWQFLDAEGLDGRQPVAIPKPDLLALDPSLAEITDLPVGWHAERESASSPWHRAPSSDEMDPDPPLSPEADRFLAEAWSEYGPKRDALLEGEWQLASCAESGFDDVTGVVTVRFADGSEWQADGQLLGSFNPDDQTFQWAWDSPDLSEHLTRDSRIVKEIGERFDLRYLVMGGGCFAIPGPDTVDYFCSIGLKATESMGVMEAGSGGPVWFIMLKNPRWTHRAG